MSDLPKKPGSLRDRIAAFEKSSQAAAPAPTPLPRPKPIGGATWKPKPPAPSPPTSPGSSATEHERKTGGMSASDAKESIGRGVSLKERMAALQGKGGFGAPAPMPKPAPEKPKYKPPPSVAVAPAIGPETDEPAAEGSADSEHTKSPPDAVGDVKERLAESVEPGEPADNSEDKVEDADPEEEERQRRAALAARMARLGGARVGMGPPVFGRPAIPKKPEPSKSDDDASKPGADAVAASDVAQIPPLVKSPEAEDISETAPATKSPVPAESSEPRSDSLSAEDAAMPPRARTPTTMPVPAAPRRAAPPRKKPAKPTAPVPEAPSAAEAPSVSETAPEAEASMPEVPAPNAPEVSEGPSDPKKPEAEAAPIIEVDDKELPAAKPSPEIEENPSPADAEEQVSGLAQTGRSDSAEEPKSPKPDMKSTVEPVTTEQNNDEDKPALDESLDKQPDTISSPVPVSAEPPVPSNESPESHDDQAVETRTGADEHAEDEEDEAARRKRIAERMAKMGGFNPLPPAGAPSPPAPSSDPSVSAPNELPPSVGEKVTEVPVDAMKDEEHGEAHDEEEDEAARRKRVAERMAKMGGFNPLQAPPPRRVSQDVESPASASPVSPPLPLPQKRASLRQDSVSSVHSAHSPKSPGAAKPPSRQASMLAEEDRRSHADPEPIQSPVTRDSILSDKAGGIKAEPKEDEAEDHELVAAKEQKYEQGRSLDEPEAREDRRDEAYAADSNESRSAKLTISHDVPEAEDDEERSEYGSAEEEDVGARDSGAETSGDPSIVAGPPAFPEPIPSPPPLPLKTMSREASQAEQLPAMPPRRTLPPPPPRLVPQSQADDEEDDEAIVERPPVSTHHPVRAVPPPPPPMLEEQEAEVSDGDDPAHPIPPRNIHEVHEAEDEEDDETPPLPRPPPPQHRLPPPPRHIRPPVAPYSSGPSSPLEQSSQAESGSASPLRYEQGTDEPGTPSQASQPDDEALPTLPRLSTPVDTPDDDEASEAEHPLSGSSASGSNIGKRRADSMKSPTSSLRSPLSPSSLAPPPDSRRALAVSVAPGEILDEDEGDPIDPSFHSPVSRKSSNMDMQQRHSGPTSPTSEPEQAEDEEQARRQTIAERMAKLGGIQFGAAPPPVRRPQPPKETEESASATPGEESEREDKGAIDEEALDEEEEERARKQRITAKLASMGGMRFGMLPAAAPPRPVRAVVEEDHATSQQQPEQPPPAPPHRVSHSDRVLPQSPVPTPLHQGQEPAEEVLPPPPPRRISYQPPPRRAPPPQPQEIDSEQSSQTFSDDGVEVEAEESELEEVGYEEAEEAPPPVPVRMGRPAQPSDSAVPPTMPGRRPSGAAPPVPGARPPIPTGNPRRQGSTGSNTTLSPVAATGKQVPSEYVMVEEPLSSEAEEISLPPPPPPHRPSSRQPPSRTAPPPPQDLSASGQWEIPSVPATAIDFDSETPDLSLSNWSEDPNAPGKAKQDELPPPPPPHAQQTPAPSQTRRPASADDLMLVWGRVGVQICESATTLHDKSKRSLIGDGTYEGFVRAVLAEVPNAAPSVRGGDGHAEYGYLIYTQSAGAVQRRVAEIMPGDVVVMIDAKFKGHKGLQSYSQTVGTGGEPLVGVVGEFDGKKSKMRVFQANRHVGHQTVESMSYRLEDVKTGLIKVYRVLEA